MKILLDTHVALWTLFESSKIPADIDNILTDNSNEIYYSIVSVWEIAIKHKIHPEQMPVPEEKFVELCDKSGFSRLNITPAQIYHIKDLKRDKNAPKHNDPFDRLLIAQAVQEDMMFITHDDLLPSYEVTCIKHF